MRNSLPVLVLLVLAACGDGLEAQLVTGSVDTASFPVRAAGVRVLRGDAVVALAPLSGEDFLLAIPPGGPARVELHDAAGAHVAWLGNPWALAPLELEVCKVVEPLDLGRIAFDRTICLPTQECFVAQTIATRCWAGYAAAPLQLLADGTCTMQGPVCEEVCGGINQGGNLECNGAFDPSGCNDQNGFLTCMIESNCTTIDTCCAGLDQGAAETCSRCAPDSPTALPAGLTTWRLGCEP